MALASIWLYCEYTAHNACLQLGERADAHLLPLLIAQTQDGCAQRQGLLAGIQCLMPYTAPCSRFQKADLCDSAGVNTIHDIQSLQCQQQALMSYDGEDVVYMRGGYELSKLNLYTTCICPGDSATLYMMPQRHMPRPMAHDETCSGVGA